MGDSFHDGNGPARLAAEDRRSLGQLARGRDWFWIAGNHDPALPADLPGERVLELAMSPLLFRHMPQVGADPGELAGHLHPKAAVHVRGRRISRRCFIADESRAVLPAYGAYAGGLDVFDRAFAALFPADFTVWLCGPRAVHKLKRKRLIAG
jgi:DNA ligase-associated metallophosphoesterase